MTQRARPGSLDLVAAAVLAAFAMALVFFPFPNPDLYWLLATGRRMAQTRAFIYHDPFTFTVAGSPWSPQSWLTAIVYLVLFKAGGMTVLTVLRMLLVAVMAALTLRSLRLVGASWAMSAPLVLCGLLVAHTRLTDRGQLFEYVCLAWLVGFLLSSHERRGRSFFTVPVVVQVFWVQFHSSFLLGPALAAIFFVSEWIATHVPGLRPLHARDFRRSFALVGLLVAVCVVNPNPRAFLIQPFDPEQRALLARFTLEWKSPFDDAIASGNFHPFYEVLLVLAGLAILSNLRKLAPAALIAATAFMSFQSHRFRVEFALVAVPMIALLVRTSPLFESFTRVLSKRKRTQRVATVFGACGLVLTFGLMVVQRDRVTAARHADTGRPERALAFMLENDVARRPFHSIAFGSYLLWDAYGVRKTFIDGRNFDARLHRDFLLAQASDEGWRAAIKKYRVDSFLLPAPALSDAGMRNIHQRLVANRAEWDLVHIDDEALVYVSKASVDSTWLDAHAFRAYHPGTFGAKLARAELPRVIAELDRATTEAPDDADLWLHLGLARDAMGEPQGALDAFARATALEPDNALAWDQTARAAMDTGRLDVALAASNEVVRLVPDDAGAYLNLARVYEAREEVDKALQACVRALAIEPRNMAALEMESRLRGR